MRPPVNLGKKYREEKGLKGGVIRLVFIMALAMPEGFSPTAGGAEYPAWMKINAEKGIVTVDREDAESVFYNDLPVEEADKWADKIQHQGLGVYTSTTNYAAWRRIPSTFVFCKQDKTAITPELADFMIQTARKEQRDAFDVVETCEDAGHCVMTSHPA
ncbi:alpha/beta-hydrolase [Fusarium austroafricanum]|uniref:Alpha/beta-hydrolase n=1 Tax=Fusarium austroafricanum TaxID=2364996 RepID=A0A8H4KK99_9HYPO|nr:alpha/beta-hydrolase [Fusarium austroafricanum]